MSFNRNFDYELIEAKKSKEKGVSHESTSTVFISLQELNAQADFISNQRQRMAISNLITPAWDAYSNRNPLCFRDACTVLMFLLPCFTFTGGIVLETYSEDHNIENQPILNRAGIGLMTGSAVYVTIILLYLCYRRCRDFRGESMTATLTPIEQKQINQVVSSIDQKEMIILDIDTIRTTEQKMKLLDRHMKMMLDSAGSAQKFLQVAEKYSLFTRFSPPMLTTLEYIGNKDVLQKYLKKYKDSQDISASTKSGIRK